MTKAIGNTTSGAEDSTPKKTYFDWRKAQEHMIATEFYVDENNEAKFNNIFLKGVDGKIKKNNPIF